MKFLTLLSVASLLSLCADSSAQAPAKDEIEIQVLAILVSEHHQKVDPKLVEFAKLVKVKHDKLTGFDLERSTSKKLNLGQTEKFDLVEKEAVEVTVNKERNEKGRITLTITPPKLNQITYECACNKFFSMATGYYVGEGKERRQLFIAIMAAPCKTKP